MPETQNQQEQVLENTEGLTNSEQVDTEDVVSVMDGDKTENNDVGKAIHREKGLENSDIETAGEYRRNTKTNRVAFGGDRPIEGADVATFEVIDENYAKDRNSVYYRGNKIEGADEATFEVINENYAKDKNGIYSAVNKIEGADEATFQVINENYAKDKNNVYWSRSTNKIEGADVATFEVIGKDYAKDKNNVYRYDGKIEGADPKIFKI